MKKIFSMVLFLILSTCHGVMPAFADSGNMDCTNLTTFKRLVEYYGLHDVKSSEVEYLSTGGVYMYSHIASEAGDEVEVVMHNFTACVRDTNIRDWVVQASIQDSRKDNQGSF